MSQNENGLMFGKYPAVVVSYDAETRECIIKTPTSDTVDAEIQYPIGDNSKNTEININAGDKVWCEYISGDSRKALITGWRNPKTGNSKGIRKIAHDQIDLSADQKMMLKAGSSIKLESDEQIDLSADQKLMLKAGSTISLKVGGMELSITSSDVVVNGISIIKHVHTVIKEGLDTTPPH